MWWWGRVRVMSGLRCCESVHVCPCRQAWADYFQRDTSIVVAFWSALMETQDTETTCAKSDTPDPDPTDAKSDTMETLSPDLTPLTEHPMEGVTIADTGENEEKASPEAQGGSEGGVEVARKEERREELATQAGMEDAERGREDVSKNNEEGGEEAEGTKLLTREQLIELFRAVSPVPPGSLTTLGMVSLSTCNCEIVSFVARLLSEVIEY